MAKKQLIPDTLTAFAGKTALEMGLELCEVRLEREPQGLYLRFYLDREGGLSLDDCERYHRQVQPKAESVDYDFMEVCSPGLDRPVRTDRDIRKALGRKVSVRLYKPQAGRKVFEGILRAMDADKVELEEETGTLVFERRSTALVRLVPDLSALEGDGEDLVIDTEDLDAFGGGAREERTE